MCSFRQRAKFSVASQTNFFKAGWFRMSMSEIIRCTSWRRAIKIISHLEKAGFIERRRNSKGNLRRRKGVAAAMRFTRKATHVKGFSSSFRMEVLSCPRVLAKIGSGLPRLPHKEADERHYLAGEKTKHDKSVKFDMFPRMLETDVIGRWVAENLTLASWDVDGLNDELEKLLQQRKVSRGGIVGFRIDDERRIRDALELMEWLNFEGMSSYVFREPYSERIIWPGVSEVLKPFTRWLQITTSIQDQNMSNLTDCEKQDVTNAAVVPGGLMVTGSIFKHDKPVKFVMFQPNDLEKGEFEVIGDLSPGGILKLCPEFGAVAGLFTSVPEDVILYRSLVKTSRLSEYWLKARGMTSKELALDELKLILFGRESPRNVSFQRWGKKGVDRVIGQRRRPVGMLLQGMLPGLWDWVGRVKRVGSRELPFMAEFYGKDEKTKRHLNFGCLVQRMLVRGSIDPTLRKAMEEGVWKVPLMDGFLICEFDSHLPT